MSHRRPWRAPLLVLVAGVVVLLVVQQLALRDLRRLEAAYIGAREPTACATQALTPGAFSTDQSHLTETVLRLVTTASDQSQALRRRYHETDHVRMPLLQLQDSERAIGNALDAQISLYEAMVGDPQHSEPKLRTLGLANTEAERRLRRARRVLLVGEAPEWKRRFICDHGV